MEPMELSTGINLLTANSTDGSIGFATYCDLLTLISEPKRIAEGWSTTSPAQCDINSISPPDILIDAALLPWQQVGRRPPDSVSEHDEPQNSAEAGLTPINSDKSAASTCVSVRTGITLLHLPYAELLRSSIHCVSSSDAEYLNDLLQTFIDRGHPRVGTKDEYLS
jgi:hypothetical protein